MASVREEAMADPYNRYSAWLDSMDTTFGNWQGVRDMTQVPDAMQALLRQELFDVAK